MFRVSLFIRGRQILLDCRAAFLFGISFVIVYSIDDHGSIRFDSRTI